MADNVAITAGTGTSVATDDVGGAHFQKIKPYASTDGTEVPLTHAEDAAHTTGDHGIGALTVRADTPAALTSAEGDYSFATTDAKGRIWQRVGGAGAALANVSGSASSVTLQAANEDRVAVIIVNDSAATLYVKYGSTASATSYTYVLAPQEMLREELYTGILTGIWTSATGAARVTELS